jgi:hypothetical protein
MLSHSRRVFRHKIFLLQDALDSEFPDISGWFFRPFAVAAVNAVCHHTLPPLGALGTGGTFFLIENATSELNVVLS